jgi:peptide/nickel transport system substrate-binding protein
MVRAQTAARLVVAGILVTLGIAACNGGSRPGGAYPAAPLLGNPQGTGNGFPTSTPLNPSTAKGGTLRIGSAGDLDFLDPARTYFAFSWDIHQLINRTLLTFPDGTGQQALFPIGDIATAPATPTNRDRTWTYTLKSGIKFQNGSTVTSKDIKYAIERTFATKVVNEGPDYFATFLCPGGENSDGACTTYRGPYNGKASVYGLSTIKTPSANKIVFHLNQPFAEWNYVMTLFGTSPVEARIDQNPTTGGANYNTHVQATGPYEIASYVPNKHIDLVRNPTYNPLTDGTRPALPNRIDIRTDFEAPTLDRAIIANKEDLDIGGIGVQAATQATILKNPALMARSLDPLTGFTRYLAILSETPPFDNVYCRRAVEWATNKTAQLAALGGEYSGAVANTLGPPTLAGWRSFDLYPTSANGSPDIANAKKDLALCGYPSGFTTTIVVTNEGESPKQAKLIQQDLKVVGITANIREFDPSTYYTSVVGAPSNLKKDGFGLAFSAWGPDWPAPFGYFEDLVDPRRFLSQNNGNFGDCSDPHLTSLINSAVKQPTLAAEFSYWQQVDMTVLSDACDVPLIYGKALDIFSKRLTNVDIEPALGIVDLRTVGVAEASWSPKK